MCMCGGVGWWELNTLKVSHTKGKGDAVVKIIVKLV